jgi:serine/threonine-protein kinase RsbW
MCDSAGSEKLGRNGQREYVQIYLPMSLPVESAKRQVVDERAPEDVKVSISENSGSEKDVISAITCIYDEYRYTYGYERLYYPETFKELINTGRLRSFLATGDNGEIAGHYCLSASEDCPQMPEWATVVVRRPFRGRYIFDRMCEHGVEMARQSGARAIMMQPTAYHTATQRVAEKHGYTATGFLFQYVNADMESEYNTDAKRLDLAIAVRFLTENPTGIAYLPEEHREFIKGIYEKLGAKYEFPEGYMPEQETLLKLEFSSLMKSGRVVVTRAGKDFERELAHATGVLRRNKAEMVEMLINMTDPAAPFAYELAKNAKNCGYFFTGIMPGSEKADYLVMQNLFWSDVDAAAVATRGEYTELLRYLSENVDCVKGFKEGQQCAFTP